MDSLLQDLVDGVRSVVQSGRDPIFLASKVPSMLEDGFQLVMGDANPSHALSTLESLGGLADCRTLLQQFNHFPPNSPSSPNRTRDGGGGGISSPRRGEHGFTSPYPEDNAHLALCMAALKLLLLDGLLARSNGLSLVDSLQELSELITRAVEFNNLGAILQGLSCVLLTCGIIADATSNQFLQVGGIIQPAHQNLTEALGTNFSIQLLDLIAGIDVGAPALRFTLRCALKAQYEWSLFHLRQHNFPAARIRSDYHMDALVAAMRSPSAAPETADLLTLHVVASRWDKHYFDGNKQQQDSVDGDTGGRRSGTTLGTDLIETAISAGTHSMQLSAILHQNSLNPVVQEALSPEVSVLTGLLCALLCGNEVGGQDSAASITTSIPSRTLRTLQASFSYQNEWVGPGSRSSHLVAASLSTGLTRLHCLLLQCNLVSPEAVLSIQDVPLFLVHSAAFTGSSSSIKVGPGCRTCITLGACSTPPSPASSVDGRRSSGSGSGSSSRRSIFVQFEPDQVAPQRIKLTPEGGGGVNYGTTGGSGGGRKLVAFNSDAPSFSLELLRTAEYSEGGTAVCCSVVTTSQVLVYNDCTHTMKSSSSHLKSQSRARSAQQEQQQDRDAQCAVGGAPCARCRALVAAQVASMESTIQRTEKQRDELVECVSALRTDVELTSNHIVTPLQAEVAALRKKLALSQKELLTSLTVVKDLTGENEELHGQLRAQEVALERVEQARRDQLTLL